jgi:anaphase-promoting complex subunit 7
LPIWQGNLCLALNRSEAAVMAFRRAQALKADLRSYQGRHTPCLES